MEEGLKFKKEHDLLYFQETSAKLGGNVEKMFIDIAKFIYLKHKDQMHKMFEEESSSQNSNSNSKTESNTKSAGASQNKAM